MRQKLQQFAVGFIVILLALVFALEFGGPQAEGCSAGGASVAAKVYSTTITAGEFRAAYTLAGFDRYDSETAERQGLKEMIINGLVERVLLARAAREAGFTTDEDKVMRRLAEEGTAFLSLGTSSGQESPEIPVPVRNREGEFDPDSARSFIQYGLRRSMSEFAESQIEETLAHRMRQTVLATAVVSPRELWETFVRERDTVQVDYIRYAPAYYREQLQPTEEDLRSWMADNEEVIDREYQANRHRYTGLEKQVRARHILVSVEREASDEVDAAANARATSLLARARAGEDFAELSRDNSDDPGSARRGGDLGYNPRGRMVRPFDEAQFAMEEGELSDLVRSDFGYHIIKVVGHREGDVPEEEAKLELADRLYREGRSGEMAQQAAAEALASLSSGTSIEALDARLRGRPVVAPPAAEGQEALDALEAAQEEEEEELDPLAPQVQETREFGRADSPIPGPFDNRPLVQAALALSAESPLPEAPVQLGSDWFVFRVKVRNQPTEEDYTDEVQNRIREGLGRAKRRDVIELYVHGLRQEAEADGAIRINQDILRTTEEADEEEPADQEEES